MRISSMKRALENGSQNGSQNRSQNRSLERGISILRTFRPGVDLLRNSDIADRTGLAPATVSRLTQTLVQTGMLNYDEGHHAYRLAVSVLSLAHAVRSNSQVLQLAAPIMRECAERHKVNVGLAVADGDDMVYLESIRYARRVSFRNVVAGLRVPIVRTSLGRAYLAVATDKDSEQIYANCQSKMSTVPEEWPVLKKDIQNAVNQVKTEGFCEASWQHEVIALATPLKLRNQPIHVLNISTLYASEEQRKEIVLEMSVHLLHLADEINAAISMAKSL
jgi:DNA-binding IclR family transcriptional regulator